MKWSFLLPVALALAILAGRAFADVSTVSRNPGDVTLVDCSPARAIVSRATTNIGRVVCATVATAPTPSPTSTATATSTPSPSATPTAPVSSASATPSPTATSAPGCWPTDVPVGAVPGNPPPVFCSTLGVAPSTFTQGANSWSDTFDQPFALTGLSLPYIQGDFGSYHQAIQWQHANHWMVDFNGYGPGGEGDGGWDVGGVTMRPSRTFRFEPRTWASSRWGIIRTEPMLVVETDYAAGVLDYEGRAWGELIVTTSPQLGGGQCNNTGCLYAYDHAPGYDTVGCRLDRGGFTCANFDPATHDRRWELSNFQNEADPGGLTQCGTWLDGATILSNCGQGVGMRACAHTNPDTDCRDHIRWEISATRSAVYVNGVLQDEHSLAGKPLPAALTGGDVYVYFGSVESKIGSPTVRFHWDLMRINP